jgi:hypothetical protein
MKSIRTWQGQLLALALMSSLAACGSGEQQAQSNEPAAAPTGDTPAVAEAEVAEAPAMPEGLEISGRFADMFVTEITDDFNPGLQIGDLFPAISAMYEGEEIMSIDRFIRDKGAIFIAARSVDW